MQSDVLKVNLGIDGCLTLSGNTRTTKLLHPRYYVAARWLKSIACDPRPHLIEADQDDRTRDQVRPDLPRLSGQDEIQLSDRVLALAGDAHK